MNEVEFSISTSINVFSLSIATNALTFVGAGFPSVYLPSKSTTSQAEISTCMTIRIVNPSLVKSPMRECEGRKAMLFPPSD